MRGTAFLLALLISSSSRAGVFAEVFVHGGTRREADLGALIDATRTAAAGLDFLATGQYKSPDRAPLQTSSGFGTRIFIPLSRRYAASLEASYARGWTRDEIPSQDMLLNFGRTDFTWSLWFSRRGRVLPRLEAWLEGGLLFCEASLNASVQGSGFGGLTARSGRYSARMPGGGLRLKALCRLVGTLGLDFDIAFSGFALRPYKREGDGAEFLGWNEALGPGGKVAADPTGLEFRFGLMAPWGLK